jgi:ABC-type dipeptide/oligopeptide/nickel transport system permease component
VTDEAIRRFVDQVINALATAGIIPPWLWVVLVVIVVPIFFIWHDVSLKWPPIEEWDPEKGTGLHSTPIILDQKPLDHWE